MFGFEDVSKENIKEHNPNCPKIPEHAYRILIIGRVDLEKWIHYSI